MHPRYRRGEPFQVEENTKYGIVIKDVERDFFFIHDVNTNQKFAICKNRMNNFLDRHEGKEVEIYCSREILHNYPVAIYYEPCIEVFRDDYFDNLEYYRREAEN